MNWLSLALAALALASWLSTFLLIRAAYEPPRIGALTERAGIAFLISAFCTASVVLVLNSDSGQALFAVDVARTLFRILLLILLLVPTYWLFLWLTGRLGG